ncbi:hypothetical protein TNCT_462361 [Trichonephila clavata]|uniref:Uncharacterized protein n=1 Tax=Trichonephila clavata TaxID=2740835 RepID=A0A8X6GJI4_TRICU|nr:hypothetical protein TNCT_462361 [Trichonephila clavata]
MITLPLTFGSNSLMLRLVLIPIPLKLPGLTSKLLCLSTIDWEDLKDISSGTCLGKFVSHQKRILSSNFLTLFVKLIWLTGKQFREGELKNRIHNL